jgi:pre-mRNA-splicing factor ATP-dependent RNA helicase DHX16
MVSKMLLAAETFGVVDDVLTVAAMLDVQEAVFFRPRDKAVHADAARSAFARGAAGDHVVLLRVFNEWRDSGFSEAWCAERFVQFRSLRRARDIRDQLAALCERVELALSTTPSDADAVAKAVAAGFFSQTAVLQKSGAYRTYKSGLTVHIHPSSCLHRADVPPRWVLYHELAETLTKGGEEKKYLRQVLEVKPAWLRDLAPHYYRKDDVLEEAKKRPG